MHALWIELNVYHILSEFKFGFLSLSSDCTHMLSATDGFMLYSFHNLSPHCALKCFRYG